MLASKASSPAPGAASLASGTAQRGASQREAGDARESDREPQPKPSAPAYWRFDKVSIHARGRRDPGQAAPSPAFRIGAAHDPQEREAERAAERAVAAPRRRDEQKGPDRQRSPTASATGLFGAGAPLAQDLRERFEPQFGVDFGAVRVHPRGPASLMASAIGARAFALGGDIAFAPGEFAPETPRGRALIAHELAHVAQAGAGGDRAVLRRSLRDDVFRRHLVASDLANLKPEELQSLHALVEGAINANQNTGWADRDAAMENLAVIREALVARTLKPQAPPQQEKPKPPVVPGLKNDSASSQILAAAQIVENIQSKGSNINQIEFQGEVHTIDDQQVAQIRNKVTAALRDALGAADRKAVDATSSYNTLSDINKKHWIASWIVRQVGAITDPGPALLGLASTANALAAQGRKDVAGGQFVSASKALVDAERDARQAMVMYQCYFEDIQLAGEFMVKELEFVRDASFIILAVCATVVTAGAAAGVTSVGGVTLGSAGAANAVAAVAPLVAQWGEAGARFINGDKVDLLSVGLDTVITLVMYRFGGRLGGSVAGRIIGQNPAARTLGRQAVANIVTGFVLGRGASITKTIITDLYKKYGEHQKVDLSTFLGQLRDMMLDPRQAALDLILGAIAGYGASKTPHGAPGGAPPPASGASPEKGQAPAPKQQEAGAGAASTRDPIPAPPKREPPPAPPPALPAVEPPVAAAPPVSAEHGAPLPAAGPSAVEHAPAPAETLPPGADPGKVRLLGSAKKGLSGRPNIRSSDKVGDLAEARRQAQAPPPEAEAKPMAKAVGGEDFQAAGPTDTHQPGPGEAGRPLDAPRAAATEGPSDGGRGKPTIPGDGKGVAVPGEPSGTPGTRAAGKKVGATRAAPPAEGPVEAPPKPVPANDVAEPAASRAQGESNAPPVQGAAAPDPKAARVAELRRVRASNEEQINTLEGQRQTHEERRLKYQKQADELLGTTRNRNNPEYRNKMRQMNNEATLRNGVQDEINRLIGGNDRINQQVADILRPPAATPQQAGRDMETLITQQSGFPKNATKHSTSFPDASAPDGSRIPDYMPEPDGKGGWKSAARPEDALCVADSKQVAGTLPLSEQIKGFTELAARTKLRTLWIIAGPTTRIHDEIKVFAAKYGVQVFVTRQ